jgi:translation elongation factor P/translation initiation factor 5A
MSTETMNVIRGTLSTYSFDVVDTVSVRMSVTTLAAIASYATRAAYLMDQEGYPSLANEARAISDQARDIVRCCY